MTNHQRPTGQLRIGLTGGIGSGKSTVAVLLAERGAYVIDADLLSRQVLEPGTPGLAQVATHFGPAVLTADGQLDRAALARLVFHDPAARAVLNGIVHPRVGAIAAELMQAAGPGTVVVYDVPLLVETGRAGEFDAVVVVAAAADRRRERLRERGMTDEDAAQRMAAQASDEQRAAVAWRILDNSGTRAQLRAAVERLWHDIEDLRGSRGSV